MYNQCTVVRLNAPSNSDNNLHFDNWTCRGLLASTHYSISFKWLVWMSSEMSSLVYIRSDSKSSVVLIRVTGSEWRDLSDGIRLRGPDWGGVSIDSRPDRWLLTWPLTWPLTWCLVILFSVCVWHLQVNNSNREEPFSDPLPICHSSLPYQHVQISADQNM